MDRGTNTLAARGLEELFFPAVLLCQFFVLAGNRFCFYILTYITKQIILRTKIFLIVVEVLAMFIAGFLC
jgi:hypothetical protein